jgi:hypothetical protein
MELHHAVARNDLETVVEQTELAGYFGGKGVQLVGPGREAKAGPEFLGQGGAAQEIAALKHAYGQAGAGEIGGCDEAIVASSDDGDIEFHWRIPLTLTDTTSLWDHRQADPEPRLRPHWRRGMTSAPGYSNHGIAIDQPSETQIFTDDVEGTRVVRVVHPSSDMPMTDHLSAFSKAVSAWAGKKSPGR